MFALMISQNSLKMGHLGKKLGHNVKSQKYFKEALEDTFSVQYSRKLVTLLFLMISQMSLETDHVW